MDKTLNQILYYNCTDNDGPNIPLSTTFQGWIAYAMFAGILGLLAGIMTTYYGQGAAGSGVAEIIGYQNGVNYPDFIGIETFFTKVLAVTLAVTGKLCIGKEGPLAHIGSIIGVMCCYIPGFGLEFLQNDEKKR